jgi:uncharacterized secreted protein with C-terminal beta-propeller domain
MMRNAILPTVLSAALLAAAGCSADDPDAIDNSDPSETSSTDPQENGDDDDDAVVGTSDDPVRFAKVALRQFDECDAFLDYVHTEGAERVGPYGFGDGGWYGPDVFFDDQEVMAVEREEAMEEDQAVSTEAQATAESDDSGSDVAFEQAESEPASGDESGGTFSTTNTQVEGVDEPDIVKTDGERILAVINGRLVYVSIAPDGTAGERRGSIDLTQAGGPNTYLYGQEILVNGDRAFVIAQVEGGGIVYDTSFDEQVPQTTDLIDDGDAEAEFAGIEEPMPTEPFPDQPFFDQPFPGGYNTGPVTAVIEVDLANPDSLQVVNTLTLDGRYVSARSIAGTARIAVTTPPTDLGFLYPSSPNAEASAAEANRELVRQTTLADWLPGFTLTAANGSSDSGSLVDCARIHAPGEFAGFDMLSVVTLSLDESLGAPADTTSIMATGNTVYASQDRMYIATNEWIPPTLDEQARGSWEETYQTGIHRFALPTDAGAEYEASGTVDGHLLNQFSMHDRDGTFFVATTTGTPWSSDGSESQIVSMRPNGDILEHVGQVGGLGKGEQIFSVRYVDQTAYVVTFRQTDPFYVVDLGDPAEMIVRGELKIPGVSTYLHPISDSLVLGVGQDATEEGFQTGSKVSLFDVSDPSDPREVDVWTLPNSNSDAEFDHRAFLWWAPTSTAVLPLVSWQDQFAGAVVLNVTEDGITEQGRVSHVDEDREESGITDCRVLTIDDAPDESFGDLFWITQDAGTQVQLCGRDDQGGATGYSCDTFPADDAQNMFWFGEDGLGNTNEFPVDLEGVDRIEWCWQDGGFNGYEERIIRTMVIDGQLWSLSNGQLQANDLSTLETTNTVNL